MCDVVYYIDIKNGEKDGFADKRQVPTIGDLPEDSAWELSEYFSHTLDRYLVGGIKTPDLYIPIDEPIVKMRREFRVQDGEKPYYQPTRELTPDESFRITGVLTRLLEEKERKIQRQREMVARIYADELSEEDV